MTNNQLAWGARVSPAFAAKTVDICKHLGVADSSWLMACMAFETGTTFSPSVINAAGSGAVGLIQFMPQTATMLGTSTEELAAMVAVQQLDYVEAYFLPRAGHLRSLGDLYGAILWPGMIGKPDDWVVFDQVDDAHPKRYLENRGLDFNHNGKVTRAEVVAKVQAMLTKGYFVGNVLELA